MTCDLHAGPAKVSVEHSIYSSQREILLEHLFTGEVMRQLWLQGIYDLEVLKPQVDDAGYDLVFETATTVRHVQLKSTKRDSSLGGVNVSLRLALKPSGCVVIIEFDDALALGPFYWFGAAPGEKLPDISSGLPGIQKQILSESKASGPGSDTSCAQSSRSSTLSRNSSIISSEYPFLHDNTRVTIANFPLGCKHPKR